MCEISCKNSEQLLRKWQKTLGDTFFAISDVHGMFAEQDAS